MIETFNKSVKIATIKGKKVEYDFCSEEENTYTDIKKKKYLGRGTIFSVNGVEQSGKQEHHFWIHK